MAISLCLSIYRQEVCYLNIRFPQQLLLLRFKMPRINGHAGINSDNVQVLYMKYIYVIY